MFVMRNDFEYFDKKYDEYKNSFNYFLENIEKLQNKQILYDKEKQNNLANFVKRRVDEINLIEENFTNVKKSLDIKRAKLIAEINRYKIIFSEGKTKYGFMTNEIASRIKELEESVNELINIHQSNFENEYNRIKASKEKEFSNLHKSILDNYENLSSENTDNIKVLFNNACSEELNFFNEFNPTKDDELIDGDISIFNYKNYTSLCKIGKTKYTYRLNEDINKEFNVVIPFLDKKSVLIIHDDETSVEAENIHDSLVMRTLLSSEVGKMKFTFCDLKGTGEFYREFIPISHEVVRIANGRINLESVLRDIENSIQEYAQKYTLASVSSNFDSLGKFNYDKIINNKTDVFVQHNIVVILNLSYEADENMVRKIKQLIQNGTKNGTQFILSWNINDDNEKGEVLLDSLCNNNFLTTIDFNGNKSNFFLSNKKNYEFTTHSLPENKKIELVESFNNQYNECTKTIAKVNFKDAIPKKENWFKLKSDEEFKVPIGMSKDHRDEQNIVLKTGDLQAHILMSGGTGSGKTNFLKTYITSACINYSPEELELYLIDLKNGIGFNIFNEFKLPHTKLYALGAENELIYNLLSNLNDEMNKRLNMFKDNGVEDINKFKQKNPSQILPRILVIIDEFSTVFEEGNAFQDEICAKISPLAKKARAAGINLLFSTQNFNSISNGAFNKLKSEFPVRVVLKSGIDASNALLTNNDAIKKVNTVGDGVINYKSGVKHEEKDNEFFKTYLLENEDLEIILSEIKNSCEKVGFINNEQLIYNNLTDADVKENHKMLNYSKFETFIDEDGNNKKRPNNIKNIPIWLGEPTTISQQHFKIELERNFNENILISGIEKKFSINAIFNIISSLSYVFASNEIAIRVFSFLNEEEFNEMQLEKLKILANEYDFELLNSNDFGNSLSKLYNEFEVRQSNSSFKAKRIFTFFIGLEKARDLYKIDTFDLNDNAIKISKIVENGPSVNIHTIFEVRQPSYLKKIFEGDKIINQFKHRVVFHLGNTDESYTILGNKIASSIYKQDEPYTRSRAVYYNAEFESTFSKFKPYINLINNKLFVPKDFGEDSETIEPIIFVNNTSEILNIDEEATEYDEEIKISASIVSKVDNYDEGGYGKGIENLKYKTDNGEPDVVIKIPIFKK